MSDESASRGERGKNWAERRTAWAAAAWAFAFASVSFYWAAGGRVGVETIAAHVERVPLANDPLVVMATGVAKVAAGCLPIALRQAPAGSIVWRLSRAAVAVAGGGFALYGLASLADHGAMVAGLRPTPAALGSSAARWHLLLWDPFWILGGALFLATARGAGRR